MASISGGDKINQVLADMLKGAEIRMNVGILAGSTNEDTGEPIAPYAAANEFGTKTIPARPFMRNTAADKTSEWADVAAKAMKGQAQNADGFRNAFTILGMTAAQDIKDTIEHSVSPPNAQSTIDAKRRKGRAMPEMTLVDSGSMQRAVDFEIIEGNDNEPA
ncbi:hypothetical protein Q6301_20070 [Klebsiella quasipneumoniae]|uniref:hypothetical protein n=1 Tax=Klebsiella quasipneumoniae TaxID=1463165 RepID=UPI00272F0968|nr:hypothetical protein [Klebsiella quasipneumoniae]MDP1297873.1 hypothetical protein [Klebsiella quasipneumoniae]